MIQYISNAFISMLVILEKNNLILISNSRWIMNNFVGQWALKTLINTGESGIVYCMECRKYVGLTLTWDVLK